VAAFSLAHPKDEIGNGHPSLQQSLGPFFYHSSRLRHYSPTGKVSFSILVCQESHHTMLRLYKWEQAWHTVEQGGKPVRAMRRR
jgi:hypothetical protein